MKMVLLAWTKEALVLLHEMVLSALTKEVMVLPHEDGSISLDQGFMAHEDGSFSLDQGGYGSTS
jgi:hypothetical protein